VKEIFSRDCLKNHNEIFVQESKKQSTVFKLPIELADTLPEDLHFSTYLIVKISEQATNLRQLTIRRRTRTKLRIFFWILRR